MSDRYVIATTGGCLGPAVPEGTGLVVDPNAEIKPLSIVALVLKPGGPWGKYLQSDQTLPLGRVCKLFLDRCVRNGRELLLVGQLFPPAIGVVALDEIEALHRIVEMENGGREAWQSVREEFNLIAWARGENTIAPINPE
jgi:hypothetical protein